MDQLPPILLHQDLSGQSLPSATGQFPLLAQCSFEEEMLAQEASEQTLFSATDHPNAVMIDSQIILSTAQRNLVQVPIGNPDASPDALASVENKNHERDHSSCTGMFSNHRPREIDNYEIAHGDPPLNVDWHPELQATAAIIVPDGDVGEEIPFVKSNLVAQRQTPEGAKIEPIAQYSLAADISLDSAAKLTPNFVDDKMVRPSDVLRPSDLKTVDDQNIQAANEGTSKGQPLTAFKTEVLPLEQNPLPRRDTTNNGFHAVSLVDQTPEPHAIKGIESLSAEHRQNKPVTLEAAQLLHNQLTTQSSEPISLVSPIDPAHPYRSNVNGPPQFQPQVVNVSSNDASFIAVATKVADQIEVKLKPEELGGLNIKLETNRSDTIVLVSAERPETLELARRHHEVLSNIMQQLGYKNPQFSFQNQSNQHSQEKFDLNHPLAGTPPEVEGEAIALAVSGSTGLDKRI